MKALEEIDRHIVGPLLEALATHGDWRIMISPDHPTFLRTKVHTHGNVPVAMAGTGIAADEFTSYGDTNAAQSKLAFDEGWEVMRWFIGKKLTTRMHDAGCSGAWRQWHSAISSVPPVIRASLVIRVLSKQ